MVRPRSEEVARSQKTPVDPDSLESELEARRQPTADDQTGAPVPEENRPGRRPAQDQDQPDHDELARRLGIRAEDAEADREDAEEVYEEIADRNPDDTTAREAYEREMAERGRSDEARDVGEHLE